MSDFGQKTNEWPSQERIDEVVTAINAFAKAIQPLFESVAVGLTEWANRPVEYSGKTYTTLEFLGHVAEMAKEANQEAGL